MTISQQFKKKQQHFTLSSVPAHHCFTTSKSHEMLEQTLKMQSLPKIAECMKNTVGMHEDREGSKRCLVSAPPGNIAYIY